MGYDTAPCTRCLGTCVLFTIPKSKDEYIKNWWNVVNWPDVEKKV